MTSSIVLLTNPIDPDVAASLSQRMEVRIASATDGAALRHESRDASFIIVRASLPNDLFDHTKRLRGVVRHGAGLDMIPVQAASRHGIAVANVPAVNASSVAEYAVGQMLALARHLPRIDAAVRGPSWEAARQLADQATELQGKTVAIVGMGAIGQALARICALGFGMRVLGVRRTPQPDSDLVRYVPLDDALAQADYVVLACPLDDSTRGLISAPRLARIRPGTRLVNVSRGAIIDEDALVAALKTGRVAGAALDVFTVQPLPAESPLRSLPNVLLSPHLAGITRESMRRMSEGAASQVLEMLEGRLPRHFVNPEAQDLILERWSQLAANP